MRDRERVRAFPRKREIGRAVPVHGELVLSRRVERIQHDEKATMRNLDSSIAGLIEYVPDHSCSSSSETLW